MFRTELDTILRGTPAWTTTNDGNAVTRQEWLDIVIDELPEHGIDPLQQLADKLKADTRKSISTTKILEMIKEIQDGADNA